MQCRAGRQCGPPLNPAWGCIAGGEHSPETGGNEIGRNVIYQAREDAAWSRHEPEVHQSAANSASAGLRMSCQRPDG